LFITCVGKEKKNGHACAMRNSENGKYNTLLTRTAVYFCKNYCFILASAVHLCWLCCLKWCCVAYFVCFAVFFFDCSSSRFEKTIEQRRTPAGWRAWPWHVCGRTYVAFFLIFFSMYCLILCTVPTDCDIDWRWFSTGRLLHFFTYYFPVYYFVYCLMMTDDDWLQIIGHSTLRAMWLSAPVLTYIPVDFWHWMCAPPQPLNARVGVWHRSGWLIRGKRRTVRYL